MTDSHLGHKKLLEYGGRSTDFTRQVLDGVHKVQGDILIHLGDVCIGNDWQHHTDLLVRAKSRFKKVILVRGNHDGKSDNWYYDIGWDFVCRSFTGKYFGKKVLFTHIPLPMEHDYRTDFNVHGHLHGGGVNSHRIDDIPEYDDMFHIDVAPEIHGYTPVELKKLIS